MIPFNKPYLSGPELRYIEEAVRGGQISGGGAFTHRCQHFFEKQLGIQRALLTTSCTTALETAALLLDLKPGDEVIVPSYTFVSTANAFVLRGARIVFADSGPLNPNLDEKQLEALITPRTRAIVPMHYAGVACAMDEILALAQRHNLVVVEDAAQGIDSFYRGRPLGTIGALAAFSFHETKNIIAGEGGLLAINEPEYAERALILSEKGTNRSAFFRGEVDKYSWVDVGTSLRPSELIAAFLWAQLENMTRIQARRRVIWERYQLTLGQLANRGIGLPQVPDYATNNWHMFYLICRSLTERTALIEQLKKQQIHPVFHYVALHRSPYYTTQHDGRSLPWADHYTDCLMRLPFYFELTETEQERVIAAILAFYATC